MNIDWTLSISDLLLVGGGIIAFIKMSMSFRDAIRDLTKAVGSKNPPEGLLGDMEHTKAAVSRHNDWLVELRAKFGANE